jgi:tRNA 2-thiouridine synthesizing protein A
VAESGSQTADQVLDCSGVSCPLPVVRTAQAIKAMEPGQILEVIATDQGVEPDMKAWCGQTGNHLLGIDKRGDTFHVLIRRAR